MQPITITCHRSREDTHTDESREITWETFCELLSDHAERERKEGIGFSPTRYRDVCTCGSPNCHGAAGHRVKENAIECFVLGIDLDKSESGGPLGASEAVRHLKTLREIGYAHVWHTTHSHAEPDHVSLRVALPLTRPITAEEFPTTWRAIVDHLGIPSGIKTDNIARFWYFPTNPPGTSPEAQVIKGLPIPVDDFACVPETIPERPEPGEFEPPPMSVISGAVEMLDALGPHVQGVSGDAQSFRAVNIVLNDYAIPRNVGEPMLRAWNAHNTPPWDETKFQDMLDRAPSYAQRPYGEARQATELVSSLFPEVQGETGKQQAETGPIAKSLADIVQEDRPPIVSYTTGLVKLDTLTGGGVSSRTCSLVSGPPGAGKSGFATALAKACGLPNLYVSTELESHEMVARYAAEGIGKPWTQIVRGKVHKDHVLSEARKHPAHIIGAEELPLDSDEAFKLIANETRRLVELLGPILLIIDYVQDLVRTAINDPRIAVGLLGTKFRILSQYLNIPILLVSSVSRAFYSPSAAEKMREYDDPTVYLAAAKESGGLDFSCATVMFLDVDKDQSSKVRPARIAVAKARHGMTGFVGAAFKGETGHWFERAEALLEMSVDGQKNRHKRKQDAEDDEAILAYLEELGQNRVREEGWNKSKLRSNEPGGVGEKRTTASLGRLVLSRKLVIRAWLRKDVYELPDWPEYQTPKVVTLENV